MYMDNKQEISTPPVQETGFGSDLDALVAAPWTRAIYGLVATTPGIRLLSSICSLTFWICAACALTATARA